MGCRVAWINDHQLAIDTDGRSFDQGYAVARKPH
jgi:hypothetical protein